MIRFCDAQRIAAPTAAELIRSFGKAEGHAMKAARRPVSADSFESRLRENMGTGVLTTPEHQLPTPSNILCAAPARTRVSSDLEH